MEQQFFSVFHFANPNEVTFPVLLGISTFFLGLYQSHVLSQVVFKAVCTHLTNSIYAKSNENERFVEIID